MDMDRYLCGTSFIVNSSLGPESGHSSQSFQMANNPCRLNTSCHSTISWPLKDSTNFLRYPRNLPHHSPSDMGLRNSDMGPNEINDPQWSSQQGPGIDNDQLIQMCTDLSREEFFCPCGFCSFLRLMLREFSKHMEFLVHVVRFNWSITTPPPAFQIKEEDGKLKLNCKSATWGKDLILELIEFTVPWMIVTM